MNKQLREYLSEIGERGGKRKTERKLQTGRKNAARAREVLAAKRLEETACK